jgi:serine/threonine protein kinase
VLLGERVAGRFEILGETGRGGMGTVFRARDRRDKRQVALKILNAAALRNAARFEQEAAIVAGLRHPNIVEYVAHGATPDGLHYLVMEWVDGEDLAQRLGRGGLDLRDTVALGIGIARALGALHERGIVHRDVKPSNLMLGAGVERVKLVDFGVARRTAEATRLTRTGALVGTAGYMAPEQVRGSRLPIDGRADLFALGCVLYECLTGEQAFVGETPFAARAKVLVHDPSPVRAFEPAVPEILETLVMSLLARQVEARPPDAGAVERALVALGELPAGGRPRHTFDHGGIATVTSTPTQIHLCAVLVSWRVDDDAEPSAYEATIAEVASASVETIDGGLVMMYAGELGGAARLALDVAARFPRALIAVAAGDNVEAAIDEGAKLIDRIEIETVGTESDGAGVWLGRDTAGRLGEGFRVVPTGDRVRVLGPM